MKTIQDTEKKYLRSRNKSQGCVQAKVSTRPIRVNMIPKTRCEQKRTKAVLLYSYEGYIRSKNNLQHHSNLNCWRAVLPTCGKIHWKCTGYISAKIQMHTHTPFILYQCHVLFVHIWIWVCHLLLCDFVSKSSFIKASL